jgi:hypothetical protein
VPGFGWIPPPPPPPQLAIRISSGIKVRKASPDIALLLRFRWSIATAKTIAIPPIGSNIPNMPDDIPLVPAAVVETFIATSVVGLTPGVALGGVNVQLDFAGSPVQVNVMAPSNSPVVMVKFSVCD